MTNKHSNLFLINLNTPLAEAVSIQGLLKSGQFGKKFSANVEKLRQANLFSGTDKEYVEYLMTFDPTIKKNGATYFFNWFKNLTNLPEDYDKFIDLLKKYGEQFSEALSKYKDTDIMEDFIGLDILGEGDLDIIENVLENVVEKFEERQKGKKAIEDIKKEFRSKAYLQKTIDGHPITFYHTTDQKDNCIIGKGTKWCLGGEKYNTTEWYHDMGNKHFFYAVFEDLKDEEGRQFKYVAVPHSYYMVLTAGPFPIDYRDVVDDVPDINNDKKFPAAKEVLMTMFETGMKKVMIQYARDFVQLVKTDSLPDRVRIPEFLARPRNLPTEIYYSIFQYLSMYAFFYYRMYMGDDHDGVKMVNRQFKAVIEREIGPENWRRIREWEDRVMFPEMLRPIHEAVVADSLVIKGEKTFSNSTEALFSIGLTLAEEGRKNNDTSFNGFSVAYRYYSEMYNVASATYENGVLTAYDRNGNVLFNYRY
jgi:hypothetical protein